MSLGFIEVAVICNISVDIELMKAITIDQYFIFPHVFIPIDVITIPIKPDKK